MVKGNLGQGRLADAADFVEALARVAQGGTALPEVVGHLLWANLRWDATARLTRSNIPNPMDTNTGSR